MGLMPLRNAIILTDAGSAVNTFFRGGENFFRRGATRDHENRRGRESPWRRLARVPFPLLRASSRAERKPRANPSGFPSPAGHESPPAAGHERTAARSARKGALHGETMFRVGRRPFSCPRVAGLSCPASDGTRRVAEGRGGGGRRSLTAAAPPDANRRSRSIAQPVFVVARSAPAPYFADFADFARDNQPRTISTQSRKERRARKDFGASVSEARP